MTEERSITAAMRREQGRAEEAVMAVVVSTRLWEQLSAGAVVLESSRIKYS
jgi:hypothetical protein